MKISPLPSVIAHRGASADAPENTLVAFREARRQGADWIELDVRPTADGRLAVHHDARLADGRAIAALSRDELPPSVAVLSDALDASAPLGVNVEIKHDEREPGFSPDRHLADMVVAALADRPVDLLVSSFDLATVDRVHELAPDLPTAYLVAGRGAADAVAVCAAHGHCALHPWDPMVDAALVARAHDAGLVVNVWTVDEPARIVELAAMGVDGIVTNRPAATLAALGRTAASR